jgi:hypothetical protein
MAWMTDPHAAQILRGLYPDQYAGWWKIWLRYGFVVLLAGIAAGGTLLRHCQLSRPWVCSLCRWRGGSGRRVLCSPIVLPRSNRAGPERGTLSTLS